MRTETVRARGRWSFLAQGGRTQEKTVSPALSSGGTGLQLTLVGCSPLFHVRTREPRAVSVLRGVLPVSVTSDPGYLLNSIAY